MGEFGLFLLGIVFLVTVFFGIRGFIVSILGIGLLILLPFAHLLGIHADGGSILFFTIIGFMLLIIIPSKRPTKYHAYKKKERVTAGKTEGKSLRKEVKKFEEEDKKFMNNNGL